MYSFHSPVFSGDHLGAYGQAGTCISWCPWITSPRQKPVHHSPPHKNPFPCSLTAPHQESLNKKGGHMHRAFWDADVYQHLC